MSEATFKCFYIKPRYYSVLGIEKYGYDGYIFSKTRGKAQYFAQKALKEAGFEKIRFIDVKLKREPGLDKYFLEENVVFDLDNVLSGGR